MNDTSCCLLEDRAIKFVFFDSNGGSSSNENNIMDIVQQAIDDGVAIEMIQSMRVKAIKRMNDAPSEEERQKAEQEIRLYNKEERILNYGEATAKDSVYDKVFRFYGPLIREIQKLQKRCITENSKSTRYGNWLFP